MKYRKPFRGSNYLYINNMKNSPHNNKFQPKINNNPKMTQSSNTVPKDININDIFNQMLNISNEIYSNKRNSVYIELTQDELNNRKIILDSLKCFILQNKIRYKLFYSIIFYFDLLLTINKKNNLLIEFEKIGLGSIILTLKYNYEEIRVITVKKFKNIFKNKYYSSKEINELEITCLKLINYNLNFPSPNSFMEIMLLNRIISYQDDIKKDTRKRIYNLIMNTLEKIICESNEYIKYNPLYLCCCIIYYTREILGLEKWPRILSNLFKTNFQEFEMIYNEYFTKYKIKERNKCNNYYSSNNNSTNMDSHSNLSNSKRNDNKKDNYENNSNNNNSKLNNYNIEKESNNDRIGIKKISLNINHGILNNIFSSEKRRKRFHNSVDNIVDKREKEKNVYKNNYPKGRYLMNKSNNKIENINNVEKNSSNNDKVLSFNYIDKYNNEIKNNKNNLINSSNGNKSNNIKTIYLNNKNNNTESIEGKKTIRNIKVCLKPFIIKQNYIQINKNLNKFINTEFNNNSNQLLNKNNNKFYENINISKIKKEEDILTKNNNYIININNNRNKRYSSCEIKKENKSINSNNENYEGSKEKNKNCSTRRNYYYLKKITEKFKEKEKEEEYMKNSFFYDYNLKKRNINKDNSLGRSIEIIQKNNYKLYNVSNNTNIKIFRKDKEEQNDEYDGKYISKKAPNIKSYRFNSIERLHEYKNSSEINEQNYIENKKNSNIRTFYKHKNSNTDKKISQNLRFNII